MKNNSSSFSKLLIIAFVLFGSGNLNALERADLHINVAGPSPICFRDTMYYTITITDKGPYAAHGTTFRVDLPSGFTNATLLSCTASGPGLALCPGPGDYTLTNSVFTGTIDSLYCLGSVVFTLRLIPPYPPISSFSAEGWVFPPPGIEDGEPQNNYSKCPSAYLTRAEIRTVALVTPTGNVGCPGSQTFDYTIHYINDGCSRVNNLRITDILQKSIAIAGPSGTSIFQYAWTISNQAWSKTGNAIAPAANAYSTTAGTITSGSAATFAQTVTITVPYIPSSDTVTLTFKLNITPSQTSGCGRTWTLNLTSQSTINYPADNIYLWETNTTDNTSTSSTSSLVCSGAPLCKQADLKVVKTVTPTGNVPCPASTQTFDYTVHFINAGPDSANNAQISDVLKYLDYYQNTGTSVYHYGWYIENQNWSKGPTDGAVLPASPAFSITSDTITAPTPTTWSYVTLNQTGTILIPKLPPGDTVTLTYRLRIRPIYISGCSRTWYFYLQNFAYISLPAGNLNLIDPVPSNNNIDNQPVSNSFSCNGPRCPAIDLRVVKTVTPSGAVACPGTSQTFAYTVHYINDGPIAADGARIYDRLYQDIDLVNNNGGMNATYNYTWTIDNQQWSKTGLAEAPAADPFPPARTSGTINYDYGNETMFSYFDALPVPKLPAGDTVTLTYTLTVTPHYLSGCGRTWTLKIKNEVYNILPAGNPDLRDSIDNNRAEVNNSITCAAPLCPSIDLRVVVTRTPTGAVACPISEQAYDYTIHYINDGPDSANLARIRDYLYYNLTVTGNGTSILQFPWAISNQQWSFTGGAVPPAAPAFPPADTSGILTATTPDIYQTNPIKYTNVLLVPKLPPGDTVTLTYRFKIRSRLISGCGKVWPMILYNTGEINLPSPAPPNLYDRNNTNNSVGVSNNFTCTPLICPTADLQTISTITPTGIVGCPKGTQTFNYSIRFVNNGLDSANNAQIQYTLTKSMSSVGMGTSVFHFPWTITEQNWIPSGGATVPSGVPFATLIDTIKTSTSAVFNQIGNRFIPKLPPGGAVTLTFKLNITPLWKGGCGKNWYLHMVNYGNHILPTGNPDLLDTNPANNSSSVTNYIYMTNNDLSVNHTITPPNCRSGDTLTFQIKFENTAVNSSPTEPAMWVDTLPSTFNIITSSITCVQMYGTTPCPVITYNPSNRVLTCNVPSMQPTSGLLTTFKGVVISDYSVSERNTVRSIHPCIDCVPDSDTTIYSYYVEGKCMHSWAGYDGDTTVCENPSGTINLYRVIDGEYQGGHWERISGTGGVFDSINGTFKPEFNATTSKFWYIIDTPESFCPKDTCTATVYINTSPPTPTGSLVITNSTCTNCLLSGGSIAIGSVSGTGGTLQFSTDGGTTWSSNLPVYNQSGPAQTIHASMLDANGCRSANLDLGSTVPGICTTPSAPLTGAVTQPTCTTPTGIVELSGLPSPGTWTLTRSPGNVTYTNTGSNYTVQGLPPNATYTFTVKGVDGCASDPSASVFISPIPSIPVLGGATKVCVGSTANVTPGSGGTWISSNTGIATVNNSGEVRGISAGSVTLTYTRDLDGCSNTLLFVVNAVPPNPVFK